MSTAISIFIFFFFSIFSLESIEICFALVCAPLILPKTECQLNTLCCHCWWWHLHRFVVDFFILFSLSSLWCFAIRLKNFAPFFISFWSQSKYENLIAGTVSLESHLHRQLTTYLNGEIANGTIADIDDAMQWMRSTFLYVRMLAISKNCGIDDTATVQQQLKGKQNMNFDLIRSISDFICPSRWAYEIPIDSLVEKIIFSFSDFFPSTPSKTKEKKN